MRNYLMVCMAWLRDDRDVSGGVGPAGGCARSRLQRQPSRQPRRPRLQLQQSLLSPARPLRKRATLRHQQRRALRPQTPPFLLR